jgi:hypothetical protein
MSPSAADTLAVISSAFLSANGLAAQNTHCSPAPGNRLLVGLAGSIPQVGSADRSLLKPRSSGRRVTMDGNDLCRPAGLRDKLDSPGASKTKLVATGVLEANRIAARYNKPVAAARGHSIGIQVQFRPVEMNPAATVLPPRGPDPNSICSRFRQRELRGSSSFDSIPEIVLSIWIEPPCHHTLRTRVDDSRCLYRPSQLPHFRSIAGPAPGGGPFLRVPDHQGGHLGVARRPTLPGPRAEDRLSGEGVRGHPSPAACQWLRCDDTGTHGPPGEHRDRAGLAPARIRPLTRRCPRRELLRDDDRQERRTAGGSRK